MNEEEKNTEKFYIIEDIWHISRYYSYLLQSCEKLRNDGEGHDAMILLLNIFEMSANYAIPDRSNELCKTLDRCHKRKILNLEEYKYLNNSKNSIRILRNIYMHKNLIKYNIIFKDSDILWPLTEYDSNNKIYDELSTIIFKIINKFMLQNQIIIQRNISDIELEEKSFIIREVTAEELMKFKGLRDDDIIAIDKSIRSSVKNDFEEFAKKEFCKEDYEYQIEKEKLIMVENSSDINMLSAIFKQLF